MLQDLGQGTGDPVLQWRRVLVYCIPKTERPESAPKWRPLVLLEVLLKLHTAAMARALRRCARLHPAVIGFRAGMQPLDITEHLRCMLAKAHIWGESAVLVQGDVRGAFDNIVHNSLVEAMGMITRSPISAMP